MPLSPPQVASNSTVRELASSVAELASEHADESDRLARLAPTVAEALRTNGLLTVTVPHAYGGNPIGLVELVDMLGVLGRGDGAAGWCAMIGVTTASLAAFTDPDAARTIFSGRDVATAGVFAPNGVGRSDGEHGWKVTGRWSWGSGSQHASWVTGGTRCDDDVTRLCWFPVDDVTFHDNWDTVGLRGSGSVDFEVADAQVSRPFAVDTTGGPRVDEPIAQFPNFTLLAIGVASVALGIARRALDELVDLANGKTPQYSSRTLAESSFTQTELAKAEARLRAARAFVIDTTASAWSHALAGDPVSIDDRVAMRLAACHAATECVAVTDTAWTLAGGTAVAASGALGRCMRDAHMVTQHVMVAPKLNETLGKYYVGADFRPLMI